MGGVSLAASLRGVYRTPVYTAKGRYYGRIREALFHPERPVVVGYLVGRRRFLFLIDRADRHLALDRTEMRDSKVHITCTKAKEAHERVAAERLGIDWDLSVIWAEMPARTQSGKKVGRVYDAEFDPATGQLLSLQLGGSTADNIALGKKTVRGALAHGYSGGFVVMDDSIVQARLSGGAAEAAGRNTAIAKHKAQQAAQSASVYGKAAGKVLRQTQDENARNVSLYGKAAAKVVKESRAGKNAAGWFKLVKNAAANAMSDPDKR